MTVAIVIKTSQQHFKESLYVETNNHPKETKNNDQQTPRTNEHICPRKGGDLTLEAAHEGFVAIREQHDFVSEQGEGRDDGLMSNDVDE